MTFKKGDVVEWSSQAAGSWKTKRGTIQNVSMKYAFMGAKEKTQVVKVLVQAQKLKSGKPSIAKAKEYWPRASTLKIIEG